MNQTMPMWAFLGLYADISNPAYGFTVVKIDMTAYRPTTEGTAYGNPFQKQAITNSLEENPGAGIRVNGDDDNNNSTADCNDTTVSGENDLIEVELNAEPYPVSGVTYVLKRSSSNIKVWNNQTKGTVLLDSGTEAEITFSASTKTVWVENPNGGTADLEFIASAGENDICSDKVHFYPFTGISVGLSGHAWGGLVDIYSNGMYSVSTNLYLAGYDVHYYDEEEVNDDGSGIPYSEITNAILSRAVTKVAIFGHSHGGGAVRDLAQHLDDNRVSIGAFTIPITVYVDAIVNGGINTDSETNLPPSTLYHVNYYQTNDWPCIGTSVLGAAINLNVNTTEWGSTLDHGTIDNNTNVINAVLEKISEKLSR